MDKSELKGRVESRLSLLFCNALPVARWSDSLRSTVDRKHRCSQVIVHWTTREADCPLEHSVSHRALKAPVGQQIDLPWERGILGQVAFKLGLQLQTFQESTVTDLGLEVQYHVSLGLQLMAPTSVCILTCRPLSLVTIEPISSNEPPYTETHIPSHSTVWWIWTFFIYVHKHQTLLTMSVKTGHLLSSDPGGEHFLETTQPVRCLCEAVCLQNANTLCWFKPCLFYPSMRLSLVTPQTLLEVVRIRCRAPLWKKATVLWRFLCSGHWAWGWAFPACIYLILILTVLGRH